MNSLFTQSLATEDDIARARNEPAFRQQLMAENLDLLLEALNKMRRTGDLAPEAARQIKEGADLAVKLADLLQHHALELKAPKSA
jgi:hypothetical protein